MSQLHELTEKIKQCIDGDEMYCDSIIRQYLEEKAMEAFGVCDSMTFMKKDLDNLLGLTDKEKPVEEVKVENYCCEHLTPTPSEAKKYGPWSFPAVSAQVNESWKFCPICGTPRPTPKSKREELAEKFMKRMKAYPPLPDFSATASKLADIAIAFLESK